MPVNEPKQTDADGSLHGNWQELIQDFYLRSYKTLSSIGMVMSIHPGYWQVSRHLKFSTSFPLVHKAEP